MTSYDDFLIARNPDGDSTLPYLLRVPLGPAGVVLKARDTWPHTAKVYCHRVDAWPADAEIVERVATRSCVRRGALIELVLDRTRLSRSQLVITTTKGREAVFWQTAKTRKQARPAGGVPRARASGVADLEIVVDSGERYGYTFADRQAHVVRRRLTCGDYAVERDGRLVAVVERKSLEDLVGSLSGGRLRNQLAELVTVPRAAVVVEERYSSVFRPDFRGPVTPAQVADQIAECQVRWPSVPIVFCETRKLAQEWTYRFLAAAMVGLEEDAVGEAYVAGLAAGPPVEPVVAAVDAAPGDQPSHAVVRAWAASAGIVVSPKGRVSSEVIAAYLADNPGPT